MNLLPVLIEQTPQMKMCDWCPRPGSCCSLFVLRSGFYTISGSDDDWKEKGEEGLRRHPDLPFYPTGLQLAAMQDGKAPILFNCRELLPNGRCGIYSTRPMVCRIYVPASDGLCIFGANPR